MTDSSSRSEPQGPILLLCESRRLGFKRISNRPTLHEAQFEWRALSAMPDHECQVLSDIARVRPNLNDDLILTLRKGEAWRTHFKFSHVWLNSYRICSFVINN